MAKHSKGIDHDDKPDDLDRINCVEGKSRNESASGTLVKPKMDLGHTVYTDICGPFPTRTWGKGKYFITFTKAKSCYLHVRILQNKSQAAEEMTNYTALMERQYGLKLKTVYSDQGGEFCNKLLTEYY